MKIIGLTGSIGMGKTVAANMLRQMGIPVFDSDLSVHEQLSPGGMAFESVAITFPDCWDKKRHIIDRKILGHIVFKSDEARRKLESILHPLVWVDQKNFLSKYRRMKSDMAALDIPLLFETGSERKCDWVICVNAPFFIQQQRVLSRPNMSEEKFYSILQQQIPNIEKTRLADFVIETGLGRAHTLKQLKDAIKIISYIIDQEKKK